MGAAGGPHAGVSPPGESPRLDVRVLTGRPTVLVVARDGDPRAALVATVAVPAGPVASTALAALVEARLSAAGLPGVDTQADRDGYRVRVLLASGAELERAVTALHAAMTVPLAEEAPARKLVSARVAALRARSLDDDALLPMVRCTGELAIAPSEKLGDPLPSLESWRQASHAGTSVVLAAVGSASIVGPLAERVQALPEWSASPASPPASGEAMRVAQQYVETGRRKGTARLSVAVELADRGAALLAADGAGSPRSALGARLAALPVPFRVRRAIGTLGREGGCVLVEAEAEPASAPLEASAAAAAAVIARDLSTSSSGDDQGEVARRVRAQGDPRDAAAAAGRWALSRPGSGPPRVHVALGLAPSAKSGDADAVASARFADAVTRALSAPPPVVEARVRAEPGQGEIWALVGSPCAVVEDATEAGLTALSLVRAARDAASEEGVTIEPWVAPDGAGLIAHALPRSGETPAAAAARVTEAAARALYAPPAGQTTFSDSRALLLSRSETTGDHHRDPLVAALSPSTASQLAPWGLFEALARGGAAAAELRREALVEGPARVAVLAPDGVDATGAIPGVVARWLPFRPSSARCGAMPAPAIASGLVRTDKQASRRHGWVSLPVDASGAGWAAASMTALALSGQGGALERALEGTASRGAAYLLGSGTRAVLVVEVDGEPDRLDAATSQVRALLSRLGRGGATQADHARALGRHEAADLAARLDPRRRLIDLFRGDAPSPAPDLAALRAWQASALRDDRVAVVLPAPAPAPSAPPK